MGESKASSMFGAGSAVLRGVISAPLEAVRRRSTNASPDHPDSVNAIIESEIIPRLLLEVFLHGIFQVNDDPIRPGGNSF